MKLWCDNKAAIVCAKAGGNNKLRRMCEIRRDYVRECETKKLVEVDRIKSKRQLADIFTKPLLFELHAELTSLTLNEI